MTRVAYRFFPHASMKKSRSQPEESLYQVDTNSPAWDVTPRVGAAPAPHSSVVVAPPHAGHAGPHRGSGASAGAPRPLGGPHARHAPKSGARTHASAPVVEAIGGRAMLTKPYRLLTIKGEEAVLCLLCDRYSANPQDITARQPRPAALYGVGGGYAITNSIPAIASFRTRTFVVKWGPVKSSR